MCNPHSTRQSQRKAMMYLHKVNPKKYRMRMTLANNNTKVTYRLISSRDDRRDHWGCLIYDLDFSMTFETKDIKE